MPGIFLQVKIDYGSQDHELNAASLKERHLVLLAELGEGEDLLGHLDDSLDGQVCQVDYT